MHGLCVVVNEHLKKLTMYILRLLMIRRRRYLPGEVFPKLLVPQMKFSLSISIHCEILLHVVPLDAVVQSTRNNQRKNLLNYSAIFKSEFSSRKLLTETGKILAKYKGHCLAISTTFFLIVILCCVLCRFSSVTP